MGGDSGGEWLAQLGPAVRRVMTAVLGVLLLAGSYGAVQVVAPRPAAAQTSQVSTPQETTTSVPTDLPTTATQPGTSTTRARGGKTTTTHEPLDAGDEPENNPCPFTG